MIPHTYFWKVFLPMHNHPGMVYFHFVFTYSLVPSIPNVNSSSWRWFLDYYFSPKWRYNAYPPYLFILTYVKPYHMCTWSVSIAKLVAIYVPCPMMCSNKRFLFIPKTHTLVLRTIILMVYLYILLSSYYSIVNSRFLAMKGYDIHT